MRKVYLPIIITGISLLFFTGCQSTKIQNEDLLQTNPATVVHDEKIQKNQMTLLFAGDIMAHSVNYNITSYDKIWDEVKEPILTADLAFANIESPIDTTQGSSTYPNFNMTKAYVEAAINAGFDVFSLCNNHTNDQLLEGIKETSKTTSALTKEAKQNNHTIYFSGLKNKPEDNFTFNYIEQNGWKIIFLPITELLNRPTASSYINFSEPTATARQKLKDYIKKLNTEHPNDLFILSIHTAEPEYLRTVTAEQELFYKELLEAGVDVLWANHTHLIKDRKYIFNAKENTQKVIMYANGNTISGQRTRPDFDSTYPDFERDNTGDGLMVQIIFEKDRNGKKAHIKDAKNYFITTYINTAWEYVIRPMDQEFINYLNEIPRKDWARYIERRIKVNNDKTKDLIEWQ